MIRTLERQWQASNCTAEYIMHAYLVIISGARETSGMAEARFAVACCHDYIMNVDGGTLIAAGSDVGQI
jgi:hypothetical protein